MTNEEINSIDPEDIEDWLNRVEKSFKIQFVGTELVGIKTFGELCDHIAAKIPLNHLDDCTTQQAFYKLREVITDVSNIENVTPATLLDDILPRKQRIHKTRQLENRLGVSLSLLQPPTFIVLPLWTLLLLSLVGFFISWQAGFYGLLVSCFGLWLAGRLGKEMAVKTVGELVTKMVRENYLASRRHPSTFNRNELENLLRGWFSEDFSIPQSNLSKDAKFT